MDETIFAEFLENSAREAQELAARSDVLGIFRLPVPGAGLFLARFALPYLVQLPDGAIGVSPGPLHVAIHFGPEYLQRVSPLEVVQVRELDLFHPNFLWPVLCVGAVRPGMSLTCLARHIFEILSYENYATDDGLHPEACVRLREEPRLLETLPRRPRLVRRRPDQIKGLELIDGSPTSR